MEIFVGCSSRNIGNPVYNMVADEIGEYIANHKHTLIFGGCTEGLMGRVFSKAKQGGSKVIATQAKMYEDEIIGLDADKIELLETIGERKNRYTEYADVLVFIPGGIGTIDELISAIETRRSNEHTHPIIIVNQNNFFGNLLKMLDQIYSEGLADESTKTLYYVANDVSEAISALDAINTEVTF